MKLNLTPQVSYLAGLCKHKKSKNGIGVAGSTALQAAFAAHVVENMYTAPQKIVIKGKQAYFFHSAYAALLKKTLQRQVDAFCHHNEYAASFLAGLFDSVGGMHGGNVFLLKCDKHDEAVLEKLGFIVEKKGGIWWVAPADVFLKFVKNYRKVDDLLLSGNKLFLKKEPAKKTENRRMPPKKQRAGGRR
ncbi:hypothetical protein COU37_05740 [Candidatus Micrarchaeota archaeon CG10_big_fil_rev_8_21_14_0_10_45_29]|nr:MAG: hypothetical protein COU37_05740 [Candidatus Micrarchaeota archaeon CG10_big_fil_rev_8_21_14_0_10_45_29]